MDELSGDIRAQSLNDIDTKERLISRKDIQKRKQARIEASFLIKMCFWWLLIHDEGVFVQRPVRVEHVSY